MILNELLWRQVDVRTDHATNVQTILACAVLETNDQSMNTLRAWREEQWQLPINTQEPKMWLRAAFWTNDMHRRNATLEAALERLKAPLETTSPLP